jgi:hypothetical protein
LKVTAQGHNSFVVPYRASKQSRRMSLKPGLSVQEAQAKKILGDAANGGDPLGEKRAIASAAKNTLQAVAEEYFNRELPKLRSNTSLRSLPVRLVFPPMGSRQIDTIKRSEIVRLRDGIAKENGPHQAQAVLAFLSKLFNWPAGRDDVFVPPIRLGMAWTKPKESARDRISLRRRAAGSLAGSGSLPGAIWWVVAIELLLLATVVGRSGLIAAFLH